MLVHQHDPYGKKSCNPLFQDTLENSLYSSKELQKHINLLYESSVIGHSQKLDPQLVGIIDKLIESIYFDTEDLLLAYRPSEVKCDSTQVKLWIEDSNRLMESAFDLFEHIIALKCSSSPRDLCLAESNFTSLLRVVDLNLRNLFFTDLLFDCHQTSTGQRGEQ